MLKTKLMLVVGTGGARLDFVAGWLGLLPNFIDTSWCIDPITGQSYGNMRFTKMLDRGQFIENVWPKQFVLSADADLYIAGTGHGLNPSAIQDKIASGEITLLSINITNPNFDFKKIRWNFLVKTYLSRMRPSYYNPSKRNQWLIDLEINKPHNEITNEDRIATLDAQLRQPVGNIFYGPPCPGAIEVEYDMLFQIGGSEYLCEKLGFNADPAHHCYWNHMLPITEAPNTLKVWDHVWCKDNYFTN